MDADDATSWRRRRGETRRRPRPRACLWRILRELVEREGRLESVAKHDDAVTDPARKAGLETRAVRRAQLCDHRDHALDGIELERTLPTHLDPGVASVAGPHEDVGQTTRVSAAILESDRTGRARCPAGPGSRR